MREYDAEMVCVEKMLQDKPKDALTVWGEEVSSVGFDERLLKSLATDTMFLAAPSPMSKPAQSRDVGFLRHTTSVHDGIV